MPLALAATATARIRRTDPSRNPGSRSFDCQVYDVWGQPLDPSQTRMNGSFLFFDCAKISHFLHSLAAHGAHHGCRLHLRSPMPTSLVGKCCVLLSR